MFPLNQNQIKNLFNLIHDNNNQAKDINYYLFSQKDLLNAIKYANVHLNQIEKDNMIEFYSSSDFFISHNTIKILAKKLHTDKTLKLTDIQLKIANIIGINNLHVLKNKTDKYTLNVLSMIPYYKKPENNAGLNLYKIKSFKAIPKDFAFAAMDSKLYFSILLYSVLTDTYDYRLLFSVDKDLQRHIEAIS